MSYRRPKKRYTITRLKPRFEQGLSVFYGPGKKGSRRNRGLVKLS